MVAGALSSFAVQACGEEPSFTRDIKGILSNRCVRCYGPDPEGRAGGGGVRAKARMASPDELPDIDIHSL
jgi:hypothetical protein